MERTLPLVHGDTLVYHDRGAVHSLVLDTPAWYTWLADASTFTFASPHGAITVRKERASNQRGGWYWKAYRKQDGKLRRVYIGKTKAVTLARLSAAAQQLATTREAAADSQPRISRPASQFVAGTPPPAQSTYLLAAKLAVPPPRPNLVPRPHVIERLRVGLAAKLTLISAPAGFGKTTLLAAWRATAAGLARQPGDRLARAAAPEHLGRDRYPFADQCRRRCDSAHRRRNGAELSSGAPG